MSICILLILGQIFFAVRGSIRKRKGDGISPTVPMSPADVE